MYQRIRNYIKDWERKCYHSGIPDEAPIRLEQLNKVPSYKQICFVILKNDYQLEGLGFQRKKCEIYNQLKRKELIERGVIKEDTQFKLF